MRSKTRKIPKYLPLMKQQDSRRSRFNTAANKNIYTNTKPCIAA